MAKRISLALEDLPEALLIHILSFLPTPDAVRSSLISPIWRNLWHHIPNLDFDIHTFHGRSSSCSRSRDSFSDFITQTLFLRPPNTPLHTFHLVFDFLNCGRSQVQVDSWVRYAIDAGVSVLRLDFRTWIISWDRADDEASSDNDLPDDAFAYYEFHFSNLRNSSVRVLELVQCDLVMPKANGVGVGVLGCGFFSSICSLSLDDVHLDDEELFVLVSGLVNLDYLSISGIQSLSNFKIHSKSLQELKMAYFRANFNGLDEGSFEVSCPGLRKIRFDAFRVESYRAEGSLLSLVEARVEFSARSDEELTCWWELMKMLSGVERLSCDNMCLDREDWVEFLGTEDFLESSAFKNLNHLELETGYTEGDLVGISSFLQVCPALESLVLHYSYEDDGQLPKDFMEKPFTLLMPTLKQVKLKNYRGTESELFLVESLKKHNVVLEEIIAYPGIANGEILPPLVL